MKTDGELQNDSKQMLKHKVITMLNRNEMEFLDKLGKDALFSTGHKLSYNEILKTLVDFAMELRISGDNIGSASAFKEKLKASFSAI